MNYMKVLFVTYFLSTGGFAASNYASVELTHLNPTQVKSTWLREKQFMPRYPVKMAMKGITGCGIFKVIVDKNGSTESIELISSVPKKVISKPVTKVIKGWSWTLADGKSPIREEKLLRLDFCIGGSTEEESISRCKQQSSMACE
ncbi:energy transducer TonB [Alteromonas sp. S015]|uniref:energy transducer TonB n=1 Tax=Alteromonas sp. S015 TaxID=3117401 RepID=UPI002FE112AD